MIHSARRLQSPNNQRTDSIESEPEEEPYEDRPGVRIGLECPLKNDAYTLFFLANIEHWYDIPCEHSSSDTDYLLNNIFTLFAGHVILITALLKNQVEMGRPDNLDESYT